jgi:hypothetical protein
MGAKKKNPPARKTPARKDLTEKQKKALLAVVDCIDEALDHLVPLGTVSREFSLVLTKLEEGQMWLDRGLEEMGYVIGSDDDDSDDDDDEPEEEPEEEEEEPEEEEEAPE